MRYTDRQLRAMVSGALRGHHRRRLERIGWLGAVDAPGGGWAAGAPPSRKESSLEILIDGAGALPRMVAELERAESHVHLAGWFFSPDFALTRGREPAVLRDLLAKLAERVEVRVLGWAGAPLPLFRPSRAAVRRMREHPCAGTQIDCALDAKERSMHCHHEKTIVVDNRIAFVGGIDRKPAIASTALAIAPAARSAGKTRARKSEVRSKRGWISVSTDSHRTLWAGR